MAIHIPESSTLIIDVWLDNFFAELDRITDSIHAGNYYIAMVYFLYYEILIGH